MQLDPALQTTTPVLWQQFRDAYEMRIILTHEYFRIDAAVVWTTIQINLPVLKEQLNSFLSNASSPPHSAGSE